MSYTQGQYTFSLPTKKDVQILTDNEFSNENIKIKDSDIDVGYNTVKQSVDYTQKYITERNKFYSNQFLENIKEGIDTLFGQNDPDKKEMIKYGINEITRSDLGDKAVEVYDDTKDFFKNIYEYLLLGGFVVITIIILKK